MKNTLTAIIVLFLCQLTISQINWEHLDGPEGGYFPELISNDSFLFAPNNDFLYRSKDGRTWDKLVQKPRIRSLKIIDNTLYSTFQKQTGEVMLKVSHDNGISWETREVNSEILLEHEYHATSHGLYFESGHRTTDHGLTWEEFGISDFEFNYFVVDDLIYIYEHWSDRLWRYDHIADEFITVLIERIAPNNIRSMTGRDSYLVVTTGDSIFFSDDLGKNWQGSNSLKSKEVGNQLFMNEDTIINFGQSIFKSIDFGKTWDSVVWVNSSDINFQKITSFKGELFGHYGSGNNGVSVYNQHNKQFEKVNDGLDKESILDLTICDQEIWMTADDGLFTFDYTNRNWIKKNVATQGVPSFIASNDSGGILFYNASYSQTVCNEDYHFALISYDCGASWDTVHLNPDGIGGSITGLEFIGDNIMLFGEYGVLYTSDDGGITWTPTELDSDWIYYGQKSHIVEFQNKYFFRRLNALRSSTNGLDWETTTLNFTIDHLRVAADEFLAAKVTDDFYVDKLMISRNGSDWIDATSNLPDIPSFLDRGFEIFSIGKGYVIRWGELGYYIATDDAFTWQKIETNRQFMDWRENFLVVGDDIYLAAEGLYKTNINDIISGQINFEEESQNTLTIQPNPSDGSMRIQSTHGLQKDDDISIYNIEGQLIDQMKIIDPTKTIEYTNPALENGSYFIILDNKNGQEFGQFVIQK